MAILLHPSPQMKAWEEAFGPGGAVWSIITSMCFLKLAPTYPSGPPGDDSVRLPLWGAWAGLCVLGHVVLTQTIHKPQRDMRVHLFFRSLLLTNKLLGTPSPDSSILGKPSLTSYL